MKIISVDCGIPEPPLNGFLGNYSSTKEGDNVTFQCGGDYVPLAVMVSTCSSSGMWDPEPMDHVCTSEEGTVNGSNVS